MAAVALEAFMRREDGQDAEVGALLVAEFLAGFRALIEGLSRGK